MESRPCRLFVALATPGRHNNMSRRNPLSVCTRKHNIYSGWSKCLSSRGQILDTFPSVGRNGFQFAFAAPPLVSEAKAGGEGSGRCALPVCRLHLQLQAARRRRTE